jgi:hypothetical protein
MFGFVQEAMLGSELHLQYFLVTQVGHMHHNVVPWSGMYPWLCLVAWLGTLEVAHPYKDHC